MLTTDIENMLQGNPYLSDSALDLVIALKIKENYRISPDIITKNLAILVDVKEELPEKIYEVSTIETLKQYTDSENARQALTNGMLSIYLLDKNSKTLESDLKELSKKAFTLIVDNYKKKEEKPKPPEIDISKFPKLPMDEYGKKHFFVSDKPIDLTKQVRLEYYDLNINYKLQGEELKTASFKSSQDNILDAIYEYTLQIASNSEINNIFKISLMRKEDNKIYLCIWALENKNRKLEYLEVESGPKMNFNGKFMIEPLPINYIGSIQASKPINKAAFEKQITELKKATNSQYTLSINILKSNDNQLVKKDFEIVFDAKNIDTIEKLASELQSKATNYTIENFKEAATLKITMKEANKDLDGEYVLSVDLKNINDDFLFITDKNNPKKVKFNGNKPKLLLFNNTLEGISIVFPGVVVFVTDKVEDKENPFGCVTVISQLHEGLAGFIFAKFLTASNWYNFQYLNCRGFTPVITSNSQAKKARKNHYTFIYKDKTTIKQPLLFYFRVGNEAISTVYVIRQVKEDIQVNIINYLNSQTPYYINRNIGMLKYIANNVLNRYKLNGIIGEESNVTVLEGAYQNPQDIIDGKVKGYDIYIQVLSAIWMIEGEISSGY